MKLNCDTIIIDGVLYEYTYKDNNIHIDESHKVSKRDMEGALYAIEIRHPELSIWQRSKDSLKREWATHNLCYALNIKRSSTKDVDLNYPQKWYVRVVYAVVGTIALLLIK